jgi:hypothetical protein
LSKLRVSSFAIVAFAIFGLQASSVRAVVTQLTPAGFLVTLDTRIAAAGAATTVNLSYAVGGFRDGGFPAVAPAVDGVLLEQLRRLKHFVETGKPAG